MQEWDACIGDLQRQLEQAEQQLLARQEEEAMSLLVRATATGCSYPLFYVAKRTVSAAASPKYAAGQKWMQQLQHLGSILLLEVSELTSAPLRRRSPKRFRKLISLPGNMTHQWDSDRLLFLLHTCHDQAMQAAVQPRPKFSPTLLNMRHIERTLAFQQEFVKADKVRKHT